MKQILKKTLAFQPRIEPTHWLFGFGRASFIEALLPALLVVGGVLALAVSAHIKVPFYPVPMTMQSLVVLLIGMSYGMAFGGATLFSYLLAGYLGAPVFAGGSGFAYMMGPTAGYLVGFLVAVLAMGALSERGWTRNWQTTFLAMLLGTVIIYLFGLAWLAYLIGGGQAIKFGLLPFIYGDMLKMILASMGVPYLWALLQKLSK